MPKGTVRIAPRSALMNPVPPPRQGRAACVYDEQAQRQHQEKMLFRALGDSKPAGESPAARPAFFVGEAKR
jgi:hypothetical protein